MKHKKLKSITLAALLSASLAFSPFSYTEGYAAPASLVKLNTAAQTQTGIDWTKGKDSAVTAKGVGLPKNGSSALARVAAVMDAQRNLLGIIKGVSIDSETILQDLMVKSDTVRREISGLLKGAQIVSEGENADGSYFVVMSVPLFGATDSVASVALPAVQKTSVVQPIPKANPQITKVPPKEVRIIKEATYTGLVVDASGLGLEPTFSPVIFDTNGRAIYGASNIDPDFAIREGMVGYAKTVETAAVNTRVTANPLVVKAVSVKGGASPNKVNAVVSVEDADRILFANESSKMLDKYAVIMVR